MKRSRFDEALEDLEDIRRLHYSGKKLFVDELNKCESVEDLKRIIKNHLVVFFDEMNFTFHMTRKSLKLIRDLNKKLEKSKAGTGEINEGDIEQEMNSVIDTVRNYKQERSNEKENKGILNGQ